MHTEMPIEQAETSTVSRRNFLRMGAGAAASLMTTPLLAKALPVSEQPWLNEEERALSLYNIHTGEKINSVYWVQGEYIQDGLEEINHLLRDRRNGEVAVMDRRMLDMLYQLHKTMDAKRPFDVISGYRSSKTNIHLRNTTSGVAKKSLHMRGMAADIRLPGANLAHLRKAALGMKAGGVGYYPESGFIHVDVGRVRYW